MALKKSGLLLIGAALSCFGGKDLPISPVLFQLDRMVFVPQESFVGEDGIVYQLPDMLADRFEVTNASFGEFVRQTNYRASGPGFLHHLPRHGDSLRIPAAEANFPVVFVSLEDAQAFAHWKNQRLPSKPEWERLACKHPEENYLSRFPPVAAYNVSGEMAMVESAAQLGRLDRRKAIMEILYSIRRAGADIILSYWSVEVADWL